VGKIDPRQPAQGAQKLVPFPLVSAETDRHDLADAERYEIIQHRAGGAGLGAHPHDIGTGRPVSSEVSARAGSISR